MKSAADIASEIEAGLALLFQGGLELSLQVQADAMAADAPEDRARLALAFHRLSRSVRQTAALRMRIAREGERAGQEADARVVKLEDVRRARRRVEIKASIERLIWTEYEPNDQEAEDLLERIDFILNAEAETADFLSEDPQAHAARLCDAIGYIPPPAEGQAGGPHRPDEGSRGDPRASSA